MAGTIPVSGNLSMENLAATLTGREKLDFERVTGLTIDSAQDEPVRNLVTTVNDDTVLGEITIVAAGSNCAGTKFLSTTAYILLQKTAIDLYR